MLLQEFFIATVPHPEWNRAHAVWGEASKARPLFGCIASVVCQLGVCRKLT
jgi:hypothetical protein